VLHQEQVIVEPVGSSAQIPFQGAVDGHLQGCPRHIWSSLFFLPKTAASEHLSISGGHSFLFFIVLCQKCLLFFLISLHKFANQIMKFQEICFLDFNWVAFRVQFGKHWYLCNNIIFLMVFRKDENNYFAIKFLNTYFELILGTSWLFCFCEWGFNFFFLQLFREATELGTLIKDLR
jgi:hypothetical protein